MVLHPARRGALAGRQRGDLRRRRLRHLAHLRHRGGHGRPDRRPRRARHPAPARRHEHLHRALRHRRGGRRGAEGLRQGRLVQRPDHHLHAEHPAQRLQRAGQPARVRPGQEVGRPRRRGHLRRLLRRPVHAQGHLAARPAAAPGCATRTGTAPATRCAAPTPTRSATRRAWTPRPSRSRSWPTATPAACRSRSARPRPRSSSTSRPWQSLEERSVNPRTGVVDYLVPNVRSKVFADEKVRLALAAATNRDAYVTAIGGAHRRRPRAVARPEVAPGRARRPTRSAPAPAATPPRPRRCSPRPGSTAPVPFTVAYRSNPTADKAMAALVAGWRLAGFDPHDPPDHRRLLHGDQRPRARRRGRPVLVELGAGLGLGLDHPAAAVRQLDQHHQGRPGSRLRLLGRQGPRRPDGEGADRSPTAPRARRPGPRSTPR